FVTDLCISNVEEDSVDVSVIFTELGGTVRPFPKLFTLAPRERREIVDFVGAPSSAGGLGLNGVLGQIVLNGCKAGQDCTPDAAGENPNYRNISVETRIYSIANANA